MATDREYARNGCLGCLVMLAAGLAFAVWVSSSRGLTDDDPCGCGGTLPDSVTATLRNNPKYKPCQCLDGITAALKRNGTIWSGVANVDKACGGSGYQVMMAYDCTTVTLAMKLLKDGQVIAAGVGDNSVACGCGGSQDCHAPFGNGKKCPPVALAFTTCTGPNSGATHLCFKQFIGDNCASFTVTIGQ